MKHEIAELLPFYANGTLDAAERARVEAELATCASCSEELHDLQTLAATLRDSRRAGATAPRAPRAGRAGPARRAAAAGALGTAARVVVGVPARYATAAALVVGFGAAAVAAWHAREADDARNSVGNGTGTSAGRDGLPHDAPPARQARAPICAAQPALRSRRSRSTTAAGRCSPRRRRTTSRALAKHAKLDVYVGDVEAALRLRASTVRGAGGDVTALDDTSPRTAGAVHGATLSVEVPAGRLDATLDAPGPAGHRAATVPSTAEDIGDADRRRGGAADQPAPRPSAICAR